MLKYMRVQVRAQISKRTEVVVLANLADFKNDPKSRVLENAYLKYTFNPKLALPLDSSDHGSVLKRLILLILLNL
jgi:hypothetical protein